MTLVLEYVARSDRGLVRLNNEDSVYAGARLLAIADGMGGHAAGEVASQLVIAAMQPLDDDEPGGEILSLLHHAMDVGNSAIAAQVEAERVRLEQERKEQAAAAQWGEAIVELMHKEAGK